MTTDDPLKSLAEDSILHLMEAQTTVELLSSLRAKSKLSNSRASSVAKEIRELIKVLSLYVK